MANHNISISGHGVIIGHNLTSHVQDKFNSTINHFFESDMTCKVAFSKHHSSFHCALVINEGIKNGISIKNSADSSDPYHAFDHALSLVVKTIRKHKKKLKHIERKGFRHENQEFFKSNKKIIDFKPFDESSMETENENTSEHFIKEQKDNDICILKVEDALMKMELANLPALVFVDADTRLVSFIYKRNDGCVSLIEFESQNS